MILMWRNKACWVGCLSLYCLPWSERVHLIKHRVRESTVRWCPNPLNHLLSLVCIFEYNSYVIMLLNCNSSKVQDFHNFIRFSSSKHFELSDGFDRKSGFYAYVIIIDKTVYRLVMYVVYTRKCTLHWFYPIGHAIGLICTCSTRGMYM